MEVYVPFLEAMKIFKPTLCFHSTEDFLSSLALQPVLIALWWPCTVASEQEHVAEDWGDRGACSSSAASSIEKVLLLTAKMSFPLTPSTSPVHVADAWLLSWPATLGQHEWWAYACPLTVASVLQYFRPEFRKAASFKGALSRNAMNYKLCEMFNMTELFGSTFKPLPKLSSIICFIKHISNFAVDYVSSRHSRSSV